MKRPSLPAGIKRFRAGYRVWVRVASGPGGLKSKVFPAHATLSAMKDWREDQRVAFRTTPKGPQPDPPAGFAADAERYLKTVKAMPSYTDRKRDIDAWIAVFGETPREDITSAEIATTLTRWALTPLAASTINHRRTALMHLWRVLDGKSAANPVRDVGKFREPEPQPRHLSYAVIDAILGAMPDSKTKALLMIMAGTGFPPATIAAIRPRDVLLEQRKVYVPGRRKGGGTKGRWVPLTPRGVVAFKAAFREDLLGRLRPDGSIRRLSHSSVHKSFRLACDHVCDDGALDGVRPYDLRHSFGTAVYAASGDIRATQELMGHAKPEMTLRYTLGAVDPRVTEALTKFGLQTGERSHT